jgi:hypothetical protein
LKIGLIDVDSHNFPNLALMKISAWHKQQGDHVDWWNGLEEYDRVYQSKVFDETYTKDNQYCINAKEIIKGGTGYDLQNKLADEIEHIYPDYDLYGIKDVAYGFLTRGCPRHCNFCIVGDKEGLRSNKVADLKEFWNGQKEIKLLDPNITANVHCENLFQDLIDSKAWIDFTQGIDIRFMTNKKVNLLNQMKIKMLHFAWDSLDIKTYEKLKEFRPLINLKMRKLRVYVLTNFNTTLEQDLERIYTLKEIDYDPYVMVYDKPNAPQEIKHLQRWVNNKFIFRSCERFEDYKKGGISNK